MNLYLTCALGLAAFLLLIIAKYRKDLQFWKRQNVEVLNVIPLIWKATKKPLYLVMDDIYRDMCAKQEPFKAVECLFVSAVFIQDQEAIKNILTTQFENFPDRGLYMNHRDPLLCHLARQDYREWKPLRRKFGPYFSPTSIKNMYPSILKVCQNFVEVLDEGTTGGNHVFEMHDLCSRFAIDVICDVAFGVECNSLRDTDSKFKFYAEQSTREHFHNILQFKTKYLNIMQLLNVKYHSQETTDFFKHLIEESLEYREKHNIRRQDFMDMLIEMKNDPQACVEYPLTLERIVGQVFLFFAAGYNSTSTGMCEAFYEMAKNPKIQDKARAEALNVLANNGGELTYENTKQLKYIKQIILETLRKYPLIYLIPRWCRQLCTLPTLTGSYTIQPDTFVLIPVHSVHHNPDFYPEPAVFRPERFDDGEEAASRPSCSYLTFGSGPKTCLGEHFSLTELAAGICILLSKFRFSVCEQTPEKLVFNKEVLCLSIDNIHLKVEKLIK